MLRIDLELSAQNRSGFLFNVGDSVSNDGYGKGYTSLSLLVGMSVSDFDSFADKDKQQYSITKKNFFTLTFVE